jgi:hypothetical protein
MNYKFSGHETFNCKPIWLKKGYDFANTNKLFNDKDAVIDLGVGKNMVASIKFWLRAFGFYDLHSNRLQELPKIIFDDNGFDPYLENEGTLYLLHYLLIKNVKIASIYFLIFKKFSKEKTEFTIENLNVFIRRECIKEGVDFSEKTLSNDIKVFLKNYIPSAEKKNSIEDNYNGLFYDLRYINKFKSSSSEIKYRFNINDGRYLPEAIFFYVILDVFEDATSINLESIREKVSSNFLMERHGTFLMIQRLQNKYPEYLIFKDDGGRQELQIKKIIDKTELLKKYYGEL